MKAFVRSKIYGESEDGTRGQAGASGVVQTEEADYMYKGRTTPCIASSITKLQEHLVYLPLVMVGIFWIGSADKCATLSPFCPSSSQPHI